MFRRIHGQELWWELGAPRIRVVDILILTTNQFRSNRTFFVTVPENRREDLPPRVTATLSINPHYPTQLPSNNTQIPQRFHHPRLSHPEISRQKRPLNLNLAPPTLPYLVPLYTRAAERQTP